MNRFSSSADSFGHTSRNGTTVRLAFLWSFCLFFLVAPLLFPILGLSPADAQNHFDRLDRLHGPDQSEEELGHTDGDPAKAPPSALAIPSPSTSSAPSVPSQSNCACPSKPPLEQAYDDAALVFVGRVEEKRTNPLKKADMEVKFQVTRKLKGFSEVQGKGVLVYTPKENPPGKVGDCAFDFVQNAEYLIFATGSAAYFKTSSCTRSDLLDRSLMDVQRILRLYSSE